MILSYSTIDKFKKCKRWFYNEKILQLPTTNEFQKYGDRGKCAHDCLEFYYKDKSQSIDTVKDFFELRWRQLKLEVSMPLEKDKTWAWIINGMAHNYNLTSFEHKFFFQNPEYVGYADGINTNEHLIIDWKTEAYKNDTQCREQMKFYSWAYQRQFNAAPMIEVAFIRQSNKKNRFIFNDDDHLEVETTIRYVNAYIETNKNNKDAFEKCCSDGTRCDIFCPFKDVCFNDGDTIIFKLEFRYGRIYIRNILPPLLQKGLDKNFSYMVKDAKFIQQNSNWNGMMKLYNSKQQWVSMGFYARLIDLLRQYCEYVGKRFDISIVDNRPPEVKLDMMPEKMLSVELRDYQTEAVGKAIQNKISALQISTSGGKTEIAVEMIRRLRITTLFIVNTKFLMYQAKERIEKNLGISVGVIGDDICEMNDITVATIQSLKARLTSLTSYLARVQFVICDECHAIAAKTFRQVFRYLPNTHYRLGISATVAREDGNEMLIEEGVGKICFNVTTKELIEKGYIMQPTIIFYKSHMNADSDTYSDDYEMNIVNNDYRNEIIIDLCNADKKVKKILLLVKTIEHGQHLCSKIDGSYHIHSKMPANIRNSNYERFVSEPVGVLIATIKIAGEGLDIPDMHMIINAAANKGDIKSTQILGRVLRKIEGKKEALYVDFIDKGPYTKKHSKKRYNHFAEQYEIAVVDKKQNI